jgi:hypothetical protein
MKTAAGTVMALTMTALVVGCSANAGTETAPSATEGEAVTRNPFACSTAADCRQWEVCGGGSCFLYPTAYDTLNIPAAVAVPGLNLCGGNAPEVGFKAVGTQNYECQTSGGKFAWVFQAPDAHLFYDDGTVAGKHFLGSTGPTWQFGTGGTVVGSKVAAATVDSSAIPWLLLSAVSNSGPGVPMPPGRAGIYATFIQRVKTTGGLAPTTGCDASHIGTVHKVPYTAAYIFSDKMDCGDH